MLFFKRDEESDDEDTSTILNRTQNYTINSSSSQRQLPLFNRFATRNNLLKIHKPIECLFSKRMLTKENCTMKVDVEQLSCKHLICKNCLVRYLELNSRETKIKCFARECRQKIPYEYIKDLVLRTIPGMNYLVCSCGAKKLDRISNDLYTCDCGKQLCCKCGKIYHHEIPCFAIKEGPDVFSRISCLEHDDNEDCKSHFMSAMSSFENNLHPKKKTELQQRHKFNLKVSKVEYIYNPVLLTKYRTQKKKIIDSGFDPEEVIVFHATSDHVYHEICENGFKIGGVDIDVKIGQVYGFGIYTGTDPTIPIHFYSNNKIIVCKGLTGNQSMAPIKNKQELLESKFNSYFVDFHGTQTNYWIFFQRENLLPLYYIEYN